MKSLGLSGKQVAALNFERFKAWVAERDVSEDWAAYVRSNKLNRTEVAIECGFAKSVLQQNPAVRSYLADVETRLVVQGVLKPEAGNTGAPSAQSELNGTADEVSDSPGAIVALRRAMTAKARAEQRVKALEEQNAVLRAEARELRELLKQYRLIEEHLALTGRLLTP